MYPLTSKVQANVLKRTENKFKINYFIDDTISTEAVTELRLFVYLVFVVEISHQVELISMLISLFVIRCIYNLMYKYFSAHFLNIYSENGI